MYAQIVLPCLYNLLIIFLQLVNIFLSIGLAIDINREKKFAKEWRKLHPDPKKEKKNKNIDTTKL